MDRHVAACLAMIIVAAACAAPPAQAQKNEGTGVLAPRGIPPRISGAPPPKGAPPPCNLPNPSGETAIDKAICASASLLRKDRRVASLFDALKRAAEPAKAAALDADQQAWRDSRKQCSGADLVACLGRLYDGRLRELEKLTAEAKPKPETGKRK
jgi:uncharacterized protein YecT (DUF1311 family)